MDNGYGVDAISLDYRKAFDSVSHRKLLEKLKLIGLNKNLLQWLEQFLTTRTVRVKVRGSFSEWMRVLSGVPQGLMIGPLLFLLFVNDLPDWVVSCFKMFVDDTKLWRTISDESDSTTLQNDLNQLTE